MKKNILIALFLLPFSGIINAQITTNPIKETFVGDTLMHGQRFGNPVISIQQEKSKHEKNGNSTLGLSYTDSLCGLNYVQGSVLIETRYNQYTLTNTVGSGFPANITISGLSPCNIIKAYLYYDASFLTGDDSTAQVVSLTNPNSVTNNYIASNIGSSVNKRWTSVGEIGTWAFRVDVTAAISGNGVYTIQSISGFINANLSIDGATLLVLYKDPSATYMGNMIIADGCWTVEVGNASYDLGGFNVCANPINQNTFSIVADMQDNVTVCNNSPTHNATFNNTLYT